MMDWWIVLISAVLCSLPVDAAVFQEVPPDATVTAGEPHTLRCAVTGNFQRIFWAWTNPQNSLKFISRDRTLYPTLTVDKRSRYSINGNVMEGEYNLHISSTTAADAGEYHCTALEAGGVTKQYSARLVVRDSIPPSEEYPKCSITPAEPKHGQYATFSCVSAGGTPPAMLTWYRGDTPVGPTLRNSSNLQTGAYLRRLLTGWDNNVTFTCSSTSPNTGNSRSCSIVPFDVPTHVTILSPQMVTVGNTAEFFCLATSLPFSLRYRWLVGRGKDITRVTKTKGRFVVAKEGASLLITDITEMDDNMPVRCVARNPLEMRGIGEATLRVTAERLATTADETTLPANQPLPPATPIPNPSSTLPPIPDPIEPNPRVRVPNNPPEPNLPILIPGDATPPDQTTPKLNPTNPTVPELNPPDQATPSQITRGLVPTDHVTDHVTVPTIQTTPGWIQTQNPESDIIHTQTVPRGDVNPVIPPSKPRSSKELTPEPETLSTPKPERTTDPLSSDSVLQPGPKSPGGFTAGAAIGFTILIIVVLVLIAVLIKVKVIEKTEKPAVKKKNLRFSGRGRIDKLDIVVVPNNVKLQDRAESSRDNPNLNHVVKQKASSVKSLKPTRRQSFVHPDFLEQLASTIRSKSHCSSMFKKSSFNWRKRKASMPNVTEHLPTEKTDNVHPMEVTTTAKRYSAFFNALPPSTYDHDDNPTPSPRKIRTTESVYENTEIGVRLQEEAAAANDMNRESIYENTVYMRRDSRPSIDKDKRKSEVSSLLNLVYADLDWSGFPSKKDDVNDDDDKTEYAQIRRSKVML
ncbi:uncharacterized protein [Asterias amurensis]|uniref:uncharacterized protein n=1 Tax=Asterias amurensis TaxID=7602 RepID=UPI003AB2B0DC